MIKEREAGPPTAEVYRKHGLRPAAFYKVKAKYGGLEVALIGINGPQQLADLSGPKIAA